MRRGCVTSFAALLAAGCATIETPQTAPGAPSYADFLVGRYAALSRDPVVASERFAEALRNSPRDPMLLRGAAESALAIGDVSGAAKFGQQAGARDVEVASGRLAGAALALRAGRTRDVRSNLAHLEGLPSEQLTGRLMSVWSNTGDGAIETALAELGGEIPPSRSPWAALQHYQRAMVLDHAGRTEDALASYQLGDRVGGLRIAQVVTLHGQLLERAGRTVDAQALYRDFLEGVDNPGVAAELARATSGAAPPGPLSVTRGASIALFTMSVLIAQDPTTREHLGPLSLAMALDPDLESPRIAFSDAMESIGQGETARRTLSSIRKTSPYFEHAQSQIAYSLRAQGRDDEAVATLKAIVDNGGGRVSQRALADLYRNLDRNAEAAEIYARLIATLDAPKKRDWRLYFAQGATLEKLDQWPAAEAALRQALAISPNQPEVLNYLGYTWVDTGVNVREGLSLLEVAVAQEPDAGYIVDSLGWAHFRLGNFGQAVEYLERAVELSPGDPTLNDHLGDAYWRVGRRIEARYQWRRALTLNPPEEERVRLQRKVADGLAAPAR